LDAWGNRPTHYEAPNLVMCNIDPRTGYHPQDYTADWETGSGEGETGDLERTTAIYSGAAFNCFNDAKYFIASALSAISLMNMM
jgi:hypothetical protein